MYPRRGCSYKRENVWREFERPDCPNENYNAELILRRRRLKLLKDAAMDCGLASCGIRQRDFVPDDHGGSTNIAVIGGCEMFAMKMEDRVFGLSPCLDIQGLMKRCCASS
jgi:hypothetical protein